jgi:hypothetical protein
MQVPVYHYLLSVLYNQEIQAFLWQALIAQLHHPQPKGWVILFGSAQTMGFLGEVGAKSIQYVEVGCFDGRV